MRKFLIALLGSAGVMHFVKPEPFDTIVPDGLPLSKRDWTYISGAGEVFTASMLACPDRKVRRWGGLATAILMLAVWPANFKMAWDWRNKAWNWQVLSVGRLPLQIPLITAGLKIFKENEQPSAKKKLKKLLNK